MDLSELTAEEKEQHGVLFSTPAAIAKAQVDVPGEGKQWKNIARGALYILKNKETGKALVRIRTTTGKTPVNYNIVPKIATSLAGKSKSMVLATRPGEGGKLSSLYFTLKTGDVAEEFSSVYNANLPAA